MDGLYCGQHNVHDRFYCDTHGDWDHCQATGRSLLSAGEQRALMDELRAEAGPGGTLSWEQAMAAVRRRYVTG